MVISRQIQKIPPVLRQQAWTFGTKWLFQTGIEWRTVGLCFFKNKTIVSL